MHSPVPRAIIETFIGIILVTLAIMIDPNFYTIIAYVASVMSIVYMGYRMLIRELENEIYKVFEQKLKKEIDDEVILMYEKRLKKDVEDLIRLYCSRSSS